ncbi:hypothetical protein [Kitasatospora griseola]
MLTESMAHRDQSNAPWTPNSQKARRGKLSGDERGRLEALGVAW